MEDGSDCNIEAANTVRNDVKATSRSAQIRTQTATQLESHSVLNPDAHMFVIEDSYERAATQDGSEAATEVGDEAANEVLGKRTAIEDGFEATSQRQAHDATDSQCRRYQHFERASQRRTAITWRISHRREDRESCARVVKQERYYGRGSRKAKR
jgi:hypothetical protein